jgi:hypothetical protein
MTTRRLKSYTGAEGRVYRYYFVGTRPAAAHAPVRPASEYVFDVSADAANFSPVGVFLPAWAPADWTAAHGRDLSEAEKYAAVKLCLFRAFDASPDMARERPPLVLDSAMLEELLTQLDLD